MDQDITLVLGGARSGKSAFAENLVLKSGLKPVYVATGRASDDAMVNRIEIHQERRGDKWKTVEEPLALADALAHEAIPGRMLLVDCLTFWITNLMMVEAKVEREITGLVRYLAVARAPIVLVSNEVGQGVIPDNEMAREFVDLSGKAHQEIVSICTNAYFVTVGLPQKLK